VGPKIEWDKRLQEPAHGRLYVAMLEDSTLTPLARLLWGVLNSFGKKVFVRKATIARRMGLSANSQKTVSLYLVELSQSGFLSVRTRAGKNNTYFLTMPDWAFIEDPATRQAARAAQGNAGKAWAPAADPGPAGRAGRGRHAGVSGPVGAVGAFGRREPAPGPGTPQAGAGGVQKRPAGSKIEGPAPALPRVHQPHHVGSTNPTTYGPPTLPLIKLSLENYQLKLEGAKAADVSQSDTETSTTNFAGTILDKGQAPAGWTAYKDAYRAVTKRPFIWTYRTQDLAHAITQEIKNAFGEQFKIEVIEKVFKAFLDGERFGNLAKMAPYPLEALKKYVTDYLPELPAPVECKHGRRDPAGHRVELQGGRPGIRPIEKCLDCGHVIAGPWDLTPAEKEKDEALYIEFMKTHGRTRAPIA